MPVYFIKLYHVVSTFLPVNKAAVLGIQMEMYCPLSCLVCGSKKSVVDIRKNTETRFQWNAIPLYSPAVNSTFSESFFQLMSGKGWFKFVVTAMVIVYGGIVMNFTVVINVSDIFC